MKGVDNLIPPVARVIKLLLVLLLILGLLLPWLWAAQHRREAHRWREAACIWRVRLISSELRSRGVLRLQQNACATLTGLGLTLTPFGEEDDGLRYVRQ